jgi:uncharacterized protein YndB with AHSA1/START domain
VTDATEPGELTYRRVHQAPRELLFDCMTQPGHLTLFWGPAGTTTPEDRIIVDLRPGGVFQTVMVSDADGSEYTMRAVYDVVDRPAMLAWTEEGSGLSTTIRFTDLGDDRTEVITRMASVPAAYRSPEARAGFATSLDRCDAYVASLMAGRS